MNKAQLIYLLLIFSICINIACAPKLMPPEDYVIEAGSNSGCGPFGMVNFKQKRIKLHLPYWCPKEIAETAVTNHEIAHVWGIEGCKKPWCIMFEPDQLGFSPDNRGIEMLAKPFQFLFGLRFCDDCKRHLKEKGVID